MKCIKVLFLGLVFILGMQTTVHAQIECPHGGTAATKEACPSKGFSKTGDIKLDNPLGNNVESLPELVESLLNIALKIGTPIVALAIIYSGYLFVAAQGNATKLAEAKRTLMWVLIGAAILLGAYAIAKSLVSTVNAIRS